LKTFSYKKTLIIGLGLLGGSIAKSFKKYNISQNIFAFDVDIEAIELAKEQKIIDNITLLDDDLTDFDLIAICVPLNQYQQVFTKIHGKINPQSLIFDIGSVKDFKFKNIPQNFVPSHPIAGSAESGFENSNEDLFLNKKFLICKNKDNVIEAQKLFEIAKQINAIPDFIEAKNHDEIYALVSHLPQFLSFLCVEFSLKKFDNDFFKNAFRLDNSNPAIWKDIFDLNQKYLQIFYEEFFENLENHIENLKNFKIEKILEDKDLQSFIDDKIIFKNPTEQFFEKHFDVIFFRFLIVLSFLKINKINSFKNYGGLGFIDFISTINIIKLNPAKINFLLEKNYTKITNFFNNIS
jgi:prephenate dehydrogenase